jgi:ATP-dependent DNA ligase
VKVRKPVTVYSRRKNVLNERFPRIAEGLVKLPASTVIDGEVCAIGPDGRTDFTLLQNFRTAEADIRYFAFDILMLKGKSLLKLPLDERRKVLKRRTAAQRSHPAVRGWSSAAGEYDEVCNEERVRGDHCKAHRQHLWAGEALRAVEQASDQSRPEFVVGGYTPDRNGFDAFIVGFYRGKDLIYASRVRAGFVPASRRDVAARFKGLQIAKCPFANLLQKDARRWRQGLHAPK